MTRRLQFFEHQKSGYERPTQRWVCGHAARGAPCRIGPDARGRCRATFECEPRRDGDRWKCTRLASAGGPCGEGPGPDGICGRAVPRCVPVRSLRARRGRVAMWAVSVTVGLLVLVLGGAQRREVVSPGALSIAHAEVRQCRSCHEAFPRGPVGWVHVALAGPGPGGGSEKCTTCHDMGSHPLNAHSRSAADLAARRRSLVQSTGTSGRDPLLTLQEAVFPVRSPTGGKLPCSTCHREHHGSDASLTRMENARCQTCHAVRFPSFDDGHPEFNNYPFFRRSRIIFDHASHMNRYFPEAKSGTAPTACTQCHTVAPSGGMMLLKSFDQVCAACHAGEIRGDNATGAKGMSVFAVPGLDLETLRQRGVGIGGWPEYADGQITPFMRVLLASDDKVAKDLSAIRDLDLTDLRDATKPQLEAVGRVAWAVKSLLYDPIVEGPKAVVSRLERGLGHPLDRTTVSRLVAEMPQDVLLAAQKAWFPHLLQEVPRHRAGKTVPIPGGAESGGSEGASSATPAAGGGGAASGGSSGKNQENILGGSGGTLGGAGGGEASGAAGEKNQGGILGGSGGILGGGGAPAGGQQKSQENILGGSGGTLGSGGGGEASGAAGEKNQGGILGGSGGIPGGGGAAQGATGSAGSAQQSGGGILGGSGGILGGGSGGGGAGATTATQETGGTAAAVKALSPEAKPVGAEQWSGVGGWYRLDFVLYYRPIEHADRFFRTWMDLSAMTFRTTTEPAAMALFKRLDDPKATGRCGKCHSVDREASGSLNVKWKPALPHPLRRSFTTFAHEPHFSLLGNLGCRTCHRLNAKAKYMASYKDYDQYTFASNFDPIQRKVCTQCHAAGRADAECTLCHRYHVGTFPPARVNAEMSAAVKGGGTETTAAPARAD